MKLNFSELKLHAIDGTKLNIEFHKLLANAIYVWVKDIRYLELARNIYKGIEVDLSNEELDAITEVVQNPSAGIAAFVREAYKKFIKKD